MQILVIHGYFQTEEVDPQAIPVLLLMMAQNREVRNLMTQVQEEPVLMIHTVLKRPPELTATLTREVTPAEVTVEKEAAHREVLTDRAAHTEVQDLRAILQARLQEAQIILMVAGIRVILRVVAVLLQEEAIHLVLQVVDIHQVVVAAEEAAVPHPQVVVAPEAQDKNQVF